MEYSHEGQCNENKISALIHHFFHENKTKFAGANIFKLFNFSKESFYLTQAKIIFTKWEIRYDLLLLS